MTASTAQVTLLTQGDCAYCDHAKDVLSRIGNDYPITVLEVPLDTLEGRTLAAKHGVLFAPGLLVDGRSFGYGRLSERRLRKELSRHPTAKGV